MSLNIPPAALEALVNAGVVLIEHLPELIAAIQSHDALDATKKAELVAKVEAARAKVNSVTPQSDL